VCVSNSINKLFTLGTSQVQRYLMTYFAESASSLALLKDLDRPFQDAVHQHESLIEAVNDPVCAYACARDEAGGVVSCHCAEGMSVKVASVAGTYFEFLQSALDFGR
jgi:hypothetical protein